VEDGFEEAGGREWPFTNVGWKSLDRRKYPEHFA